MTQSLPKLSICIPAYNRAKYLSPLLDSILVQDYHPIEIVICEDSSPERAQIAEIVQQYRQRGVDCIRYVENEATLGFDGNLRNLFAHATGDYCVMMGNDDLLYPNSLATIGSLLAEHPEVAVAIRSYGWFYDEPTNVDQIVHYFPTTSIFEPGENTAATFFRRVGVLAGLVYRRKDALEVASDKFDGTLYYQVYLAAELLLKSHGLYIADTIAICREGKPDFGRSKSEQGTFQPGVYTPEARLIMVANMLKIASAIDDAHHGNLQPRVLADMGNYSYYFLAFQAKSKFTAFYGYYRALGRLGFASNPLFHLYFWSLAIFGKTFCETVIKFLRSTLKATPRIGNVAKGVSLSSGTAE